MVKVSKMTGKLSGIYGINFNTLENGFCKAMSEQAGTVCAHCYSRKMLSSYRKGCQGAFTNNMIVMSELLDEEDLPTFPRNSFVRFLAHGELENVNQARNFIRIARRSPSSSFALWTKLPTFIAAAAKAEGGVPDNMNVIHSIAMLDAVGVEKHGAVDATFTVYRKESEHLIPEYAWLCQGKKCMDCLHCYVKVALKTQPIIAEILR